MDIITLLVPLLGIVAWLGFIFFILRTALSKSGAWIDFEAKYKTEQIPKQLNAKNLKIRTCRFGGLQANNLLNFYETSIGLMICQKGIIKKSDYNLLIPWTEIVESRERSFFLWKAYTIIIGDPFVNMIVLGKRDFIKISQHIPNEKIKRIHTNL